MPDVQLDHLVAVARARIANIDVDGNLAVFSNLLGAYAQIGIFKCCVAQTIAERVEWLALKYI